MLLIGNGILITRDPENPFIQDGGAVIEGKLIKEAGKTAELKAKYPQAEYIDARGRLIMPGFINTHMHYYSTFARGMSLDNKPATMFSEVLKGLWWRLDKCLTLEDVYSSALCPMIDQVRSGVTTAIDHHASPYAVADSLSVMAEAAEKIGLRSNLCYETSDRDGEKIKDEGIRENVRFMKYCREKDDDMIRGMFGLHASMTISEKTLDECLQAGLDESAGFHVHCAEGIEDVADSLAKYDMRVIERFYKTGVLNEKSIAVHCIHITDDEIDMLRESGAAVVHNPQSNMSNAVGVSRVLDMMAKGVLVGMGTDGYTSDVTESYKTANVLHKHAKGIPSVGWGEPPAMLFDNNKTIANRYIKGNTGAIRKGYYADIIIVDYNAPTPINKDNYNSHILFGVSGKNVDTTIINGKIVMKDRELITVDEEAAFAKSRELASKLWKRI